MGVELAAAYEGSTRRSWRFGCFRTWIESVDFDDDRDIALRMIKDQLNENRVRTVTFVMRWLLRRAL